MLLIVAGAGLGLLDLRTLLLVQLPVVAIAGALGVWLFYVQHTFQGTYWRRRSSWDCSQAAITGSWHYDLPPVLHWFTGNVGYHHIHHLAPRIPNYRLRAAFESSPLLQCAPRLTLRTLFPDEPRVRSFEAMGRRAWMYGWVARRKGTLAHHSDPPWLRLMAVGLEMIY